MKFEGEIVLFCIVGSIIRPPPIIDPTGTLNTLPFCGILRGYLIPIVRKYETIMIHLTIPSCDVTQKLVWIAG